MASMRVSLVGAKTGTVSRAGKFSEPFACHATVAQSGERVLLPTQLLLYYHIKRCATIMKSFISIPFAIDLTREGSWNTLDEGRTCFFVARCHFMAVNQQVEGKAMLGEKLREFSNEPGTSQEITDVVERQYTVSYTEESLKSSLRESATVQSFVSSIAAETAAVPHKLSPKAQLKLSRTFREEFQSSFKVVSSFAGQTTFRHETKIILPATFTTTLVNPAVYQRCVSHLFLTHVEYLRVLYVRSLFGLRRKRTKHPPLPKEASGERVNVHKCHVPLAAIYYWQRLPESSVLVAADKYRIEVSSPDECEIRPPEDEHEYFAPGPAKPTLYQISNVAFPLKWIKRPGKGEWTEEQLRQIEEDELKESAIGPLRLKIVGKDTK